MNAAASNVAAMGIELRREILICKVATPQPIQNEK